MVGSARRPLLGERAGGGDSFQHSLTFGGRLARLLFQRRQRGDVLAILVAPPLIAPTVLGANERLRGTFAVGDVCHVEAVLLDLQMQMLPAILPHAEAMRLLHPIQCEGLQFAAIGARTRKLHVLPPVRG